jgi:hypothetical protein
VDAYRKTKMIEVQLHRFLTLELSASSSSHFILWGEIPSTHCSKDCVGSRDLLKVLDKEKYLFPLPVFKSYIFQPDGKIETNEMGRACGTYGGGERCAQGIGGEA